MRAPRRADCSGRRRAALFPAHTHAHARNTAGHGPGSSYATAHFGESMADPSWIDRPIRKQPQSNHPLTARPPPKQTADWHFWFVPENVTSLMTAGECNGASVSYYQEGNAPIPADCFPDADAGFQNTDELYTGG